MHCDGSISVGPEAAPEVSHHGGRPVGDADLDRLVLDAHVAEAVRGPEEGHRALGHRLVLGQCTPAGPQGEVLYGVHFGHAQLVGDQAAEGSVAGRRLAAGRAGGRDRAAFNVGCACTCRWTLRISGLRPASPAPDRSVRTFRKRRAH